MFGTLPCGPVGTECSVRAQDIYLLQKNKVTRNPEHIQSQSYSIGAAAELFHATVYTLMAENMQ